MANLIEEEALALVDYSVLPNCGLLPSRRRRTQVPFSISRLS